MCARRAQLEAALAAAKAAQRAEQWADRAAAEQLEVGFAAARAEQAALEELLAAPVLLEPEAEEGSDGEEDDDEGTEEAAAADGDAREPLALQASPEATGTALSAERVELRRIAEVRCETVALQLGCARCDQGADVQLSGLWAGEHAKRWWCSNCATLLSIELRPALLHAGADALGYLDCINCRVVDTTACLLLATCFDCFTSQRLPPFVRNQTLEKNCEGCHSKLACKIGALNLRELTPALVSHGLQLQPMWSWLTAAMDNP